MSTETYWISLDSSSEAETITLLQAHGVTYQGSVREDGELTLTGCTIPDFEKLEPLWMVSAIWGSEE